MAEPGVAPEAEDLLLQRALDVTRRDLQEPATANNAKAWLGPCLWTQEGTRQLYTLLQQHVSKDGFLRQLTRARAAAAAAATVRPAEGSAEVLQPNGGWWQVPTQDFAAYEATSPPLMLVEADGLLTPNSLSDSVVEADGGSWDDSAGASCSEEALSEYVLVERSDVLEAIGQFVAAYLATMPEAQHLQPKQLQKALTQTFKELQKGRVRQLWDWGRGLYRVGAVTYGAFSLYTNPWLVRAVLAAIWTASKVMTGYAF